MADGSANSRLGGMVESANLRPGGFRREQSSQESEVRKRDGRGLIYGATRKSEVRSQKKGFKLEGTGEPEGQTRFPSFFQILNNPNLLPSLLRTSSSTETAKTGVRAASCLLPSFKNFQG